MKMTDLIPEACAVESQRVKDDQHSYLSTPITIQLVFNLKVIEILHT